MSVKDLLILTTDPEADAAALAAGETLAKRFNAHLAMAFLATLPDEPLAYEPSVVAGVWAELVARARSESKAQREKLDAKLKGLTIPCELRQAEALARDLGRIAAVHARYADLAITGRPPAGDGGLAQRELVEGVLFHAGRPLLLIPPGWAGGTIGARPMLAWDASREATRALNDARGLIEGASQVTVVTVDAKPRAFGHGEQPGANIAGHLARRGFKTAVRNIDSLGQTPGQALHAEAKAMNADLIVMGGYSHARWQEMLFGGATKDLFTESSVPLLVAH
jgi:nucleotide-binding universal stress UspA family protein